MKKEHILPLLALIAIFCPALATSSGSEEAQKWLDKSTHVQHTSPTQAIYYARKSLELLPYEAKSNLRAEALYSYAQAEKLLGNFDASIKLLYDALEFVTPYNAPLEGKIYSMIGMIYCSMSDFKKALEFNEKATAIFKTESDSLALAVCYNDRGIIHCYLEEYAIAEQFLRQSLLINRSQKQLKRVAANLNNLCLYKGNLTEQIGFIEEAIIINKNLDSYWSLGENYNNLGRLYYFSKAYKEALTTLQMAYETATKIGAKELMCDNYEYSSWVYQALGQHDKSYDALLKLHLLSKELQSSHQLRTIEQEIAHKKRLKERQEGERREQELEIKLLRRNLYIAVTVLGFLIVLCLLLSMWYKRKKRKQLMDARLNLEQSERKVAELKVKQQTIELESIQQALESSRQEATSFAIFLQSRNEVLDKIRTQLKQGYKMDLASLVTHLKKINAFIMQYQSGEKSNHAVLLTIEEKNQVFLQRLTQKHPNLTQGEKTLATFLRVNLSTKEIALITGTIPKTINMNRYRLRKALGLLSEEDLTDYLQNI